MDYGKASVRYVPSSEFQSIGPPPSAYSIPLPPALEPPSLSHPFFLFLRLRFRGERDNHFYHFLAQSPLLSSPLFIGTRPQRQTDAVQIFSAFSFSRRTISFSASPPSRHFYKVEFQKFPLSVANSKAKGNYASC